MTLKRVITPTNTEVVSKPQTQDETVYRILQTIESTIELDELSLPAEDNEKQYKLEDRASLEYPLIRINDYILSRSEILAMDIDCTNFLPTIMLQAAFFSQTFMSRELPKDGDIISIAIRNKNDAIKMIRTDFVITGALPLANSTNVKAPSEITFFGELFIPGLKSQKNDYSTVGTSMDALIEYCERTGLGFATNEDDTEDKQIWLKANMAGDIFINSTVNRSWRDGESFYQCWIDLYYNLNFVNVNKQLMSSESEVDIAALMDNIDVNFMNKSQEAAGSMPKVFSNYVSFRTTPFFIHTWQPINVSSTITFQIGTKMSCEMFEHNTNLYKDPKSQKYWAITIEPTYDKNKVNKSILLRGRASFNADNDKDLPRANYSYTELYEKFPWLGIQYTISNPDEKNTQWDGNHHKNYQRARVQNLINNKELDKLNLEVSVNGTNFNIIRGDKMPVALIRKDPVETQQIDPLNKAMTALDLFYSGWFYVKGFHIKWNTDYKESIMSNFSQTFVLTRREWPTPIGVEAIKTNT